MENRIRFFVNRRVFDHEEQPRSQKLSHAVADSIKFSNSEKEILIGTILGDGSLKFDPKGKYKNCRFGMRHSMLQLRWFLWKILQLNRNLFTRKAIHVQAPDGFSQRPKLHFQTRALSCFTELHNELYTDNKLDFEKDWVLQITPVILMVWWLDDGGRIGDGGRKGKWSTQSWGLEGNKKLQEVLQEKFDISTRIVEMKSIVSGETQYYLELSQNNLKKLLRIIMPHIPVKTFVYKAFMCFKDQRLQESWIAEMKERMNEDFHRQIDILYQKSRRN
jgi:hypothetical protein